MELTEFELMEDLAAQVVDFRRQFPNPSEGQRIAARALDWLVAWNVSTDRLDCQRDDKRRAPPANLTVDTTKFLGEPDRPRKGIPAAAWTPPDDKRPADKGLERELAKAPKKSVHCNEDAMTGNLAREEPMHVSKAVKDAAAKVLEKGEEPELRETIKAQVLRGVTKALRANEAPMSGRQLLIALLEDGITINGANQVSNLAAHMYALGKFQLWPEGWWFRDEARPPRE